MLQHLFIINKAGGLIYYRSFTGENLSSNDTLRLASTFHSLHTIAAGISPVSGSSGIEIMQTDTFVLHCLQSFTNLKFFVTAQIGTPALDEFLRNIYALYSDYVLKNPFHELDQVVHSELFERRLSSLVRSSFS